VHVEPPPLERALPREAPPEGAGGTESGVPNGRVPFWIRTLASPSAARLIVSMRARAISACPAAWPAARGGPGARRGGIRFNSSLTLHP
jgi:hypothetical protein